jgi:hypothetical protein
VNQNSSSVSINFKDFFLQIFWTLLIVSFPFEVTIQYIYSLSSASPDSIGYGISAAILSFLESILVILVMGFGIKLLSQKNLSFFEHIQLYFRDMMVEIFRAIGRISIWLLWGIITLPTIYWGFKFLFRSFRQMVYYYFVPYVVQFEEKYEQGQVDVLEECEKLFKSKLWQISGILLLTQTVSFVLELSTMRFNIFTNPVLWGVLFLVALVVESYIFIIFYKYYLKRKELCH